MEHKGRKIKHELDVKGIKTLPHGDIAAILRGADDLIMRQGRTFLAKILKGSIEKKLLELELDQSPVYGFYKDLSTEEIMARIDWVIIEGYLDLEYDYNLPLLVYTEKGWGIEKDTCSDELLKEFDGMLKSSSGAFNMNYLKDKNRELIWMLLDKVEASGNKKYIPILEAWEKTDYKNVRTRINQVIDRLNSGQVSP